MLPGPAWFAFIRFLLPLAESRLVGILGKFVGILGKFVGILGKFVGILGRFVGF